MDGCFYALNLLFGLTVSFVLFLCFSCVFLTLVSLCYSSLCCFCRDRVLFIKLLTLPFSLVDDMEFSVLCFLHILVSLSKLSNPFATGGMLFKIPPSSLFFFSFFLSLVIISSEGNIVAPACVLLYFFPLSTFSQQVTQSFRLVSVYLPNITH